jgi:hypothetical protein
MALCNYCGWDMDEPDLDIVLFSSGLLERQLTLPASATIVCIKAYNLKSKERFISSLGFEYRAI